MSLSDYTQTAISAAQVKTITGKSSDMATAAGVFAWVKSITGTDPKVLRLPGNRARIILSGAQRIKMQKWLDSQVYGFFKPKELPTLEVELGPVFKPWAVKYLIPAGLAIFITGWLMGKAI